MADTITPDPFNEARSRAANALKTRFLDSARVAGVGWALFTVPAAGVAVGMVSVGMLNMQQARTAIAAIGIAVFPMLLLASELRRLVECSDSLKDLFDRQKQYEVLIADARAERDQVKSKLIEIEQLNSALRVALFSLRKEGDARGRK